MLPVCNYITERTSCKTRNVSAGASRTGGRDAFCNKSSQSDRRERLLSLARKRGLGAAPRRLLFLMANLGTHLALLSTQLSTTFSANFRSHGLSPYVIN